MDAAAAAAASVRGDWRPWDHGPAAAADQTEIQNQVDTLLMEVVVVVLAGEVENFVQWERCCWGPYCDHDTAAAGFADTAADVVAVVEHRQIGSLSAVAAEDEDAECCSAGGEIETEGRTAVEHSLQCPSPVQQSCCHRRLSCEPCAPAPDDVAHRRALPPAEGYFP